jgi:cytochrome c oxidase subunit 3
MSQWIMVKLMMWFYRIRCLNVLWFLAAYGFLDLNLLRHGHWPMKCLLTFHARCITDVLCRFNDFYFDFSSVTMVLAVDAGHQMKRQNYLYVLTIIGGGSLLDLSLGMEKFH